MATGSKTNARNSPSYREQNFSTELRGYGNVTEFRGYVNLTEFRGYGNVTEFRGENAKGWIVGDNSRNFFFSTEFRGVEAIKNCGSSIQVRQDYYWLQGLNNAKAELQFG